MNKEIFLSTLCESSYVALYQHEAIGSGYDMPDAEHCGYTLMADRLVPEVFIQRVANELWNHNFEYGYVLSEEMLFNEAFLLTLDGDERAVLLQVVMLIIARGDFNLNLWATKGLGQPD